MARENALRLRAIVADNPRVTTNRNGQYASVTLTVARPDRKTGDGSDYVHMDNPKVMTQDPAMIAEIDTWKKNDIVDVKGVLASRRILKSSHCPYCHRKNSSFGSLVYVVPNYLEKIGSVDSEKEAQAYLVKKREISNSLKIFGTLLRGPKMLSTFSGLNFTQYQIAINRKFRIKEDDPNVKTDYPWVKSYGDNAKLDQFRLQKGSEVYIDGCLQARTIQRRAFCGQAKDADGNFMRYSNGNPVIALDDAGEPLGCGEMYYWNDRALEIVPFSTEYVSNFLSEEEAIERADARRMQSLRDRASSPLFAADVFDEVTEEDEEAGIDTMDSDFVEE